MSTPRRLSTVLQTAQRPLADQPGVSDEQLLQRTHALSEENARLRLRILELEQDADMDPLVPVFNRRAFLREIARAQSVFARYDLLSSIIFMDLDGFKAINDRYGHMMGDKLLREIGETLLAGVRPCDMVARLGGDEFGILLFKSGPEIAKAKAATLACRIQDLSVEHPDGRIGISASWGSAPCEPDDTPERVLDRADRAMYIAKRRGEAAEALL